MKMNRLLVAVAALSLSTAGLSQNMSSTDQRHKEMMPVHAKLIEAQKTQDMEIDRLLAELNRATGEKRIDAVIAVLNKLVEQRKAMNAEFAAHLDK